MSDAEKVARVTALTDRWEAELHKRGTTDQLYTSGVVAMLRHALRDDEVSES